MLGTSASVAVLLPKNVDAPETRLHMPQVEMQHTAENSRRKPVVGRPFTTGDRRINRRGRPRNFDAFRELCQKICHERVTVDGEVMTRLEVILRDWAGSKDAQKQIALVQYGYGKPTLPCTGASSSCFGTGALDCGAAACATAI